MVVGGDLGCLGSYLGYQRRKRGGKVCCSTGLCIQTTF